MLRIPRPARAERDERPDRPFTGYKLAHAVVSADGTRTGFAGLTLGAGRVYDVTADAVCVWNTRHEPPRRWCGCGFYCLHALPDAMALGCATDNRSALLLEVAASGRYIRYERGLRYSRQRVRAIKSSWCGCGRQGSALADAGTGLVGWRHLAPVCGQCAGSRPALSLGEFTALLDGTVRVDLAPDRAVWSGAGAVGAGAAGASPAQESPFAVLSAEIALLHARLDDLQSRIDRMLPARGARGWGRRSGWLSWRACARRRPRCASAWGSAACRAGARASTRGWCSGSPRGRPGSPASPPWWRGSCSR